MSTPASSSMSASEPNASAVSRRLPVVFLPHGGGPWPFVDLGMQPAEHRALSAYLQSLRSLPRTPPRALLVISAHWEAELPTVMTATQPPLLFDYYGFPKATYQLAWPATGAPWLAARVQALLSSAGIDSAHDPMRGFDHGTFVPLLLTYPQADVPTIQLSLQHGLDPAAHLAMGRALAPLRDEGVFILGSGMSFHNLRMFRDPRALPIAEDFDSWLRAAVTAAPQDRDAQLVQWTQGRSARLAHPREEHLLPLMVVAGAAGSDRGVTAYNDTVWGVRLSAFHFGA